MTWTEIFGIFTRPLFQLGQTWISLATVVQFALIGTLVVLFSRLFRRLLRTRVLARTKLDTGQQYAIARIVGYVVLVLGFGIGLQTVGIDITSLTVIAGALGVGIGFGLQNIVHNFVSGLIILGERPIQIGDRVDVGGTIGMVTRIGARSTSILSNDNITIIVPNSEFMSNRVVNWSYGDPKVRFRVPVGVAYDSDPRLVEKLLLAVAATSPHVLKDPAPSVAFHEFGESALNFELRVWSVDWVHRPGALQSQLNFAIWESFKQHNIAMPFPQRDLHVKEPVRVQLTREKTQLPMIVLLMGVAGSGKTTVGRLLARDLGWQFADGDDFQPPANVAKMGHGIPLTDADREGWLLVLHGLIAQLRQQGRSAVFGCSALKQSYRARLVGNDGDVCLVYLKGDYDLLRRRLLARTGHFFKEDLLASQFATLEEPADAIVIDVTPPPETIVACIKEELRKRGINCGDPAPSRPC